MAHISSPFYKSLLHWTFALPALAWLFYLLFPAEGNLVNEIVGAVLLVASVLSGVHHSEMIAHRVGEPFGTIILALAITIIEVALIVSLMIAGGNEAISLARDTVFAAIMLIMNGILGVSMLMGGIRHFEQSFVPKAANTALVCLVAILVLTLILPNFTTSRSGPQYTMPQLIFVSVACLIIYGVFLLVQTVRHREYFLPILEDDNTEHPLEVSNRQAIFSLVSLLACLGIVVLMAKSLSPSIEAGIISAGLPQSLVGVIIAFVVLLPEGIAALKAAKRNKLQTSINLALGSALASIGLTIPAVAVVCLVYDLDLVLGLDLKSMVLLTLSVFIAMLTLSKGKTNILYGTVLLVNLMAYIFTIIFP